MAYNITKGFVNDTSIDMDKLYADQIEFAHLYEDLNDFRVKYVGDGDPSIPKVIRRQTGEPDLDEKFTN